MAYAHLAEVLSVCRTFDAVVVGSAREAVPHCLDICRDGGGSPVGIAVVCYDAAKVLEVFVFIFHRSFKPVVAVEIHHDSALVESVVALCEVGLYCKAEVLLLCLHLEHRSVVVAEMIVCALPQVGVRGSGDGDPVFLDSVGSRLAGPLEVGKVYLAVCGQGF